MRVASLIFGALSAMLALTSCLDQEQSSPSNYNDVGAVSWHTVQPATQVERTIHLTGLIKSADPEPQFAPVPNIPITWIPPDGSRVTSGSPVMRFDEQFITRLADDADMRLQVERAEQDLRLVESAISVEVHEENLAEQLTQRQLQLTRRDQAEAAIVKLRAQKLIEVQSAERKHARRLETFSKLKQLSNHGEVAEQQIREAERRMRSAEAQLRVKHLEMEELNSSTGSVQRQRAEFELARIEIQLGDEHHSGLLKHKIDEVSDREAGYTASSQQRMQYDREQQRLYASIADDPVERASDDGILEYGPANGGIGSRVGTVATFLLTNEQLTIRALLDQEQRDLFEQIRHVKEVDLTLTVDGNAIPGHGFVASLGSTIETSPDGSRTGYWATIRVDRSLIPQVFENSRISCALHLPLWPDSAQVPLWFINDTRTPELHTADGAVRKLTGTALGNYYIIDSGVSPGDVVQLSHHQPIANQQRVTAKIELADYVPMRNQRWGTALARLIPDGQHVNAGDVMAEFRRFNPRSEQELQRSVVIEPIKAVTSFRESIKRLELNIEESRAENLAAQLDAEQSEFELLVELFGEIESTNAAAEATMLLADIELEEAKEQSAALANELLARSLSDIEKRQRQRQLETTTLSHQASELKAVNRKRQLSLLKKIDADHDWRRDVLLHEQQQLVYAMDRASMEIKRMEAIENFSIALSSIQSQQDQIDQLTLHAPISGRAYQRRDRWGRPLRLGEFVPPSELFRIETSPRRLITFAIPARFYEQFADQEEVQVIIPALGHQAISAQVILIGASFESGLRSIDDITIPNYIGHAESTFSAQVVIDLTADQALQAPPGATAYMDIQP